MERVTFDEVRRRVSWGSIIAGVVTVLAVSVLLSILGTSIGLYMFDPTSSDPASGIGTTVSIWTIISMLISLFCGAYVAGKLAGSDGMIHGFLVWATSLLIAAVFTVCIAVSAVKMTANMLGSIASVTGNVISGVGSAVGSGISGLTDQLGNVFEDVDFDNQSDGDNVRQDVRQALRKSGVKEFQPEYLQREMDGIKSDLGRSAKRLATNPNDAEEIINKFMERLEERGNRFAQNIDRDDLTKAIANNSNMSKAEVDKAVDEYMQLIDKARTQGREQIENLQQTIQQAKQDLQEAKQKAMVQVDKATSAAATSGIISFIGMLIGAGLSGFAGYLGMKRNREGYQM